MGADLYIESIFNKQYGKYNSLFEQACGRRDASSNEIEKVDLQKEVMKYYDLMYSKGYFRDSYNDSSVFHMMGLSWWKDVKIENGFMSIRECKRLLKIIKNKEIPRKKVEDILKGAVDNEKGAVSKWYNYFMAQRITFIRFLEQAIKLNEPIRCSV